MNPDIAPLVVLSLDGLCRESIGAYGCRWNQTPAIDAIAASGLVFDRCILEQDADCVCMDQFWDSAKIRSYSNRGESVLVTDDEGVEEQADAFDRVVFVGCGDTSDEPLGDEDEASIERTAMGRLYMAAVEAEASGSTPISLLWVHSRRLRDCWDAPASLAPGGWDLAEPDEPSEVEFEPAKSTPDLEASSDRRSGVDLTSQSVPHLTISPTDDPNLVGDWIQRYATQVRLFDMLVEVLLASISIEDPMVVIASTGGFSLGQDLQIGYRRGAVRSPQIHVPLIVSDLGPRRLRSLVTPDDVIGWLMSGAAAMPDLAGEKPSVDLAERFRNREILETRTDRAERVLTSSQWFAVIGPGDAESLFVKPDDIHDANDVARRRLDVIENLKEKA